MAIMPECALFTPRILPERERGVKCVLTLLCKDVDYGNSIRRFDYKHSDIGVMVTRRPPLYFCFVLLVSVYVIAGKFELSVAFFHASASAVWPPAGLALAALLLWGIELWPAVFIGAVLVNFSTSVSLPTTLAIAAGNTLETVLGAWLIGQYAAGAYVFRSAQSIFKFSLITTGATLVSSTIGVTSLVLAGLARWQSFASIWLTWSLGDLVGAWILVPLIVLWATEPPPSFRLERVLEAGVLVATVIGVGASLFFGEIPSGMEYLAIPPLLWGAFRFGQRGAATLAFVMSALALAGTLQRFGPFAMSNPNTSLILLQLFIGAIAMTTLVLAAVVSERKEAEEALRGARDELAKTNQELERRVEERTADLEQARAALLEDIEEQKRLEEQLRQSQKLESIGTLAAGVAHDFNNVLNIIKGYASLLADRPDTADSVRIIDEAVERGASTVRQLLILSRKSEAALVPTSLNDLVAELARLVVQTFPKTIDIELEFADGLSPTLADANQIRQVLLNLSLNARDAMPGGGRLAFRTKIAETARPDSGATAKQTYFVIEVADTGKGMDETVRRRIFEPFFTTKQTGEGTGLGLAIAYGVVQNHGGFIDVESRVGKGTTFRIYLPAGPLEEQLSMAAILRGAPAHAVRPTAPVRRTVFIVEDEEHTARLLKTVLARRGCTAVVALDGAAALEIYQSRWREIDAVLLDIGLPKVPGWEVMRRMKEINPAVKIIVASGNIAPELRADMHRVGVNDFVDKPYTFDGVAERLENIMAAA
jgi:signal transduction histidine kinase/CheY-like chemotaxis protein